MSSAAAFDQALALVHDTLTLQKANGAKIAVPLEALHRLAEAVGEVRPVRSVRESAPVARPVLQRSRPEPPAAAATRPSAPEPAASAPAPAAEKPSRPQRFSDQVRAHLPPEVVSRVAQPVSTAEKQEKLDRLRAKAGDQLALSSAPLVFGSGSVDAEVLFVGDAPGAEEEAAGAPFMDEAGQMLTKIIELMGMRRDEVYLANLLQTRSEQPSQRRLLPEEVTLHLPYLVGQIEIVQPRCIVALGGSTVEALLRTDRRIDAIRGQWQTFRRIPVMPTFHVAYLHKTNNPLHKQAVWSDMLKVLEKLGRPITDQQRGFFRSVRGRR